MTKWILSISLIIIIIGVAWGTYVMYPRTIDVSLPGVKYQLGAEAVNSISEASTVVIQGKLHTSLKGKRTFKGEISIEGEQIPVPAEQRKLELQFAKEGWAVMSYPYFVYDERGAVMKADIFQSHLIFANKDFSQVSLLLTAPSQHAEDGSMQTGWNFENGYMLSAPAATREEGLDLSNKLMHEYLKSFGRQLQ